MRWGRKVTGLVNTPSVLLRLPDCQEQGIAFLSVSSFRQVSQDSRAARYPERFANSLGFQRFGFLCSATAQDLLIATNLDAIPISTIRLTRGRNVLYSSNDYFQGNATGRYLRILAYVDCRTNTPVRLCQYWLFQSRRGDITC